MSDISSNQAVQLLRQLPTIRERSNQLYQRALEKNSQPFSLDLSKLEQCCDFVLSFARKSNPTLKVPFHSRWRHFQVGNIDRVSNIKSHPLFPIDAKEQGRLWYELTLISVLLDAGAGEKWHYYEQKSQQTFTRSEGLAVASLDMFMEGLFSSDLNTPLQANIKGLSNLSQEALATGMQTSDTNPLLGLEGRTRLLNALAQTIQDKPTHFSNLERLGGLYDYVINEASIDDNSVDASKVVEVILDTFSDIWPGRVSIDNQNLGDVWRHEAIQGPGDTNGLIPFHKLSQWLTYSLLEPLQWQGYQIKGLEKMTGLAEYRNGGLFIDTGVINIENSMLKQEAQSPDSEAIIEWRALTICLLDDLWQKALVKINKTSDEFLLVSFLEAGTWKAGRVTAFQNNPNGQPPISIISDGTVF